MSNDLPIVFSRHSLIKLEPRHLTKEIIVKVIKSPSYLTTTGDKFHAFRKFGTRYLKVIFATTYAVEEVGLPDIWKSDFLIAFNCVSRVCQNQKFDYSNYPTLG